MKKSMIDKAFEAVTLDKVETPVKEYDEKEGYGVFYAVTSLLEGTLNATNIGVETLAGVLHAVSGGNIDDKALFTMDRLLTYLRVPTSMQDDLFSDDESEAKEELELLQEIIADRMGEQTLVEFVSHALHNDGLPDMDGVILDDASDIEMDWAFMPKKADCFKGKGKKLACHKGKRRGITGYWRYAKDFENKKTGGVSASNHKSKGSNSKNRPSAKRIWTAQSRKWFKKAMDFHGKSSKGDAKKAEAVGV